MKPTIPKGTRDFLPSQVAKRDYIFSTIREVFKRYGYQGIETPVMESLSTLTGKYGEEGDQLLFKVLNNGDFLSKVDQELLDNKDSKGLTPAIAKRGLRYDLTVPFARFVVMHQNDIQLPFKRYAIQPVWRADRPQKGRYQEFYQCDVDVVGSDSLMYEAELIKIYDEVFTRLGLNVEIKVNNRKVLSGIAEVAGIGERFQDFTIAIDKLDKIGKEKVITELVERGIDLSAATKAIGMLGISSINELEQAIGGSKEGRRGINELKALHAYLDPVGINNKLSLDVSLARGLSYYTGCILEVKALDAEMGSIGGGGRYDDLTGNFGLSGVSGVGISFGAERIYDVMEELNLFPPAGMGTITAIFLAFDEVSHVYAFAEAAKLRNEGISVDIYPEPAKFKKQIKYAGNGNYRYAVIIGESEIAAQTYTIKDLTSGDQSTIGYSEMVAMLSKSV